MINSPELETVTLRITSTLTSGFRSSRRFSAVQVNAINHRKIKSSDIYYITAKESALALEPAKGQIWEVTGQHKVQEVAGFTTGPNRKEITIRDSFGELDLRLKHIFPKGKYAFIQFIKEDKCFRGIGPDKAEKLWSEFGPSVFSILDNKDVDKLEAALGGRSKVSIQILIKGYEKYSNLKYSNWLVEKEIPLEIQKRIFRFNSVMVDDEADNIKEIIEQNPYHLTTLGLSFDKTDAIAMKHFSVDETSHYRYTAAVNHALRKHSLKGHTVANYNNLIRPLSALLKSRNLANEALLVAYDKKSYIFNHQNGLYQNTPLYIFENVVAKRLLKLNQMRSSESELEEQLCNEEIYTTNTFKLPSDATLAEQQEKAIHTSVRSHVSCISGGAGTGKTTILGSILTVYTRLGYNISPMAMTGRAAWRMKQSIGMKTQTIARFLLKKPLENKADTKHLLVIDEASMVDLQTMYRIVIHIDPSVRILLVGDPNQLPSISYGKVFSDIINSKIIPNTKLNVVKRQDETSGIPHFSNLVNDGIIPENLTMGAITFHDVPYDDVATKCTELYAESLTSSSVVASTNKLVEEINELCQNKINPDGKALIVSDALSYMHLSKCRLNDPVIFTKNIDNLGSEGVQNGTTGVIASVGLDNSKGTVKIDGTNEEIEITDELLEFIKPAYALTVHRAQGSQFPTVIIALSKSTFFDRCWFYTAITRCEVQLHIVCPHERLVQIITSESHSSLRQTNLINLLRNSS